MSQNFNEKTSSILKRVLKIERSIDKASQTCSCDGTFRPACDPRDCIQRRFLINTISKLRQQINELATPDN
jgi:hypothetical protein